LSLPFLLAIKTVDIGIKEFFARFGVAFRLKTHIVPPLEITHIGVATMIQFRGIKKNHSLVMKPEPVSHDLVIIKTHGIRIQFGKKFPMVRLQIAIIHIGGFVQRMGYQIQKIVAMGIQKIPNQFEFVFVIVGFIQ
jgi:hypothetical protein